MGVREKSVLREVPPGAEQESQERIKAEQLAALLERHQGEYHIIVLQSFPDPDAISSAFAHQMIAARYGIECDIAYDGRISHHENIAPVELLQLHFLRVDEGDDLKRYQGSVFMDTQGTTSGLTERLRRAGVPALAIIDHHEPQGVVEAQFTDIRTGANATATNRSFFCATSRPQLTPARTLCEGRAPNTGRRWITATAPLART